MQWSSTSTRQIQRQAFLPINLYLIQTATSHSRDAYTRCSYSCQKSKCHKNIMQSVQMVTWCPNQSAVASWSGNIAIRVLLHVNRGLIKRSSVVQVEYRSSSRWGNRDFDVNRKRIRALRKELEKEGWVSVGIWVRYWTWLVEIYTEVELLFSSIAAIVIAGIKLWTSEMQKSCVHNVLNYCRDMYCSIRARKFEYHDCFLIF